VTTHVLRDPTTPIGEILKAARPDGIVLETESQAHFAVIPLDDDVIDLLIERNPRFRSVCQEIRTQMESGQFKTHDEVMLELGSAEE
jgi:hypothetical protein